MENPTAATRIQSVRARLRTMRSNPPMVAYLAFLLLVTAWTHTHRWHLLGRAVIILAIYSALDLAIGYARTRTWRLPTSSWVSGLILSIVLGVVPWIVVISAPLLASLAKHVIRIRGRHVFNPAATALLILAIVNSELPIISWMGVTTCGACRGDLLLFLIIAAGLFTLVRVGRWKTWAAFTPTFLAGTATLLAARGYPPADALGLLSDPTFWFFSTVMLIEPVTTAYQPPLLRTGYGAVVGILAVFLSLPYAAIVPDPLLGALLLGNLGATIASRVIRG